MADGMTLVGGGGGEEAWPASAGGDWERETGEDGCEAPGVASVGVGAAGAVFAPAFEAGTGVEAAFGVVSATGAASAGGDGVAVAAAAGEVAAGVSSDAGDGDVKPGDAAAAGETDPGERVTSLSWI